MSQLLNNNIFYYCFILYLITAVTLLRVMPFTFVDELACLICIICLLRKKRSEFKICLCLFIFYISYSFIIHSNITIAILFDALQQIKPFAFFYFAYYFGVNFTAHQKRNIVKLCYFLVFLSIPFGVLQDISFHESLLFAHPGDFGCTIFTYVMIIYYFSEDSKKTNLISFAILLLGLLCTRSKYYGYFVCSIFVIRYLNNRLQLSVKYLLIIITLMCSAIYVAREKFFAYTSEDAIDTAARTIMYVRMPELIINYFPFGTGLASYATYFSGYYYSDLYYALGLDHILGMTEDNFTFIADTYFPMLAEFGIFGIIVFILFWRKRFKEVSQRSVYCIRDYKVALIIMIMIFIESTASPYLGTIYSFVPMLFLGNICKNQNNIRNEIS